MEIVTMCLSSFRWHARLRWAEIYVLADVTLTGQLEGAVSCPQRHGVNYTSEEIRAQRKSQLIAMGIQISLRYLKVTFAAANVIM